MKDMKRKRGDTYADELTLSKRSDGLVLDITNYAFIMTLSSKRDPTDTGPVIYSIPGIILDAMNGKVEFPPTPEQADQKPGVYWYDVQMTDAAGRIRTILEGKYTYVQDITK